MANDLNEQYFETRKKHKESYSRKGYVIWILIGIGALSFFIGREFLERRERETLKNEKLKEFLEQGVLSTNDTLIRSKFSGTSILVLEGCLYKEIESTFLIVKNDSSGLAYYTTRIIPSLEYKSSMKQWINQASAASPSQKFTNLRKDSINGQPVETADIELEAIGPIPMKGKTKIVKKGGLYYVFQISTNVSTWDKLLNQIERVENSFEIIE